jgi:hypothetical protein
VRVGAARFAPVGSAKGYVAFFVPRATWERAVRPLRAGELPEIEGSMRASISVVEVARLDPAGGGVKLFAFSGGE